uniref:DDE Tnp4 domain-containing protein n=1 Tax=Lactuca sativa TaxID=4236 RepID=A0A9R1VW19_LACSA|nr:hypothetical protein LSAT_V11C400194760 [Lactuca sativa]
MYGCAKSTTSTCFHIGLRAVVALESYYIQQPKVDVTPKEIQEKKRFYPYFKNCVGEIDGTHIRVKVPNKDTSRYRGRKGYPTINVLAACSFDLKFTYVLTGWEGTASDSRIVKDALKRDNKLLIPRGRYCLVDADLPHTLELMTPYRGVRATMTKRATDGSANPDAAAFRTKKISNYDQLVMLFSDDGASGSKAETAKEKNIPLSKSIEIKIEKVTDVDKLMENNEVILDNKHKDDDDDIQIVSATDVSPDESSKAKKLKKKLERKLQDEDEVVAEPQPQPQPESFEHNIVQTFKEIVDVMREGNKSHDYTGGEIEKELELMWLDAMNLQMLSYICRVIKSTLIPFLVLQ